MGRKRRVTEDFQEEVALPDYGTGIEREMLQLEGAACTKEQRNEEHVGTVKDK